MPEDAVMDAPDIDLGVADTPDPDSGSPDSGDTGDTPEGADTQEHPEGEDRSQTPDDGKRLVGPDGKLTASAKGLIDKLKQGTPEEQRMGKMLTRALFAEDRLRRELPGGFQELKGMRQQIEDLGGFDGLKERGAELEYFNSLDQQYTNADPKFVQAMTDTKEGQQAFLRLAPTMLAKFAELNEQGHSAYVAQRIIAHMQDARLPLAIERLADFLPTDKPQAAELWKQIAGYVNGLNDLAGKPIAPAATAQSPDTDTRQQELDRRQQQLDQKEWGNEAKAQHQGLYKTAFAKAIGNRQLTATQKENVGVFYERELAKLLPRDWRSKIDQYFGRGQKDGYLRYRQGVLNEVVPKAIKAALARAGIGAKPGPKGGAQPRPGETQNRGPQKPDQGFTFVNQKPDFSKVDRVSTTPSMFSAGKAILKDGSRVQWRK